MFLLVTIQDIFLSNFKIIFYIRELFFFVYFRNKVKQNQYTNTQCVHLPSSIIFIIEFPILLKDNILHVYLILQYFSATFLFEYSDILRGIKQKVNVLTRQSSARSNPYMKSMFQLL